MKLKVLLLFLGITFVCDAQIQIADDIKGKFKWDFNLSSISNSANGQVVVIGCPRNGANSNAPGYVRVYKLVNGVWEQLGSDINGTVVKDYFGYSVAISDDGTKLIAGAHYKAGLARAYEYINDHWTQVGNDLGLEESVDDVAISADGNIIAISNYNSSQFYYRNGLVRVFQRVEDHWVQMGGDLIGVADKDQSGWSISLSSDGKTMAIGSSRSDEGGYDSGHVRVFRYYRGAWVLLGKSIVGKGPSYAFGQSVSISSDGKRVAIGGPGAWYFENFEKMPCYVAIFDFINGEWKAVGQELNGYPDERFGTEVVLSGDGRRVAVFSRNRSCQVRIYDLIGGKWKQVGRSIENELDDYGTFSAIGMSRNGKVIAAVADRPYPGYARIHDISEIKTGENENSDCKLKGEIIEYKLYPNPTSGSLTVEGADLESLMESGKLHLFDVLGRRMEGYEVNENSINLSKLPSGTYFLMLDDTIEKIIVAVF